MEGDKPKPVYRFLARGDCAFDAQLQEDAEKRRLQREHYERLREPGGPIYYEFSSHDELRERILRINELRQLLGLRLARLPFLPMREKFTGRRPVLETVEAEVDRRILWRPLPAERGTCRWRRGENRASSRTRLASLRKGEV
jgi:hypothetical protein